MTDWPAAHFKALRKHLDAGLSASQIAAALNGEFRTRYSKNAVIGKARRKLIVLNGRSGSAPVLDKPVRTAPRPKQIQQRPDIAQRKAAAGPKVVPAVPFVPRTADVVSQNVPLLELAVNGCRWPSDAPPFVFCNCPQVAGLPYCEPHSRLAYRAPEPRTQRGRKCA